jgi:hypothetical protein
MAERGSKDSLTVLYKEKIKNAGIRKNDSISETTLDATHQAANILEPVRLKILLYYIAL